MNIFAKFYNTIFKTLCRRQFSYEKIILPRFYFIFFRLSKPKFLSCPKSVHLTQRLQFRAETPACLEPLALYPLGTVCSRKQVGKLEDEKKNQTPVMFLDVRRWGRNTSLAALLGRLEFSGILKVCRLRMRQ